MKLCFRFWFVFGSRFFILIAGLSAFASSAPASNLDMVSVSGQARTRFQFDTNPGGVAQSSTDFLLSRARLNIDLAPTKTLQFRLTPQFTNIFGSQGPAMMISADDNFTAHEAWMSYAPTDTIKLIVGRQVLSYGNELLIGTDDWFREGNDFDAVRAQIKYGFSTTDVLWAKIAGRSIFKKADADLVGFYSVLSLTKPFIKTSDFYLFWYDDRLSGHRKSYAIVGTRLAGDFQMIDYNLEVTGEFGQALSENLNGIQADATLGSKLLDIHHIALNAAYANSDFRQLYPSTHKFFGESDVVQKRNNIVALSILTDWKLGEKFTSSINGFYLFAPSDSLPAAGGRPLALGQDSLGLEGDIDVTYTPEKLIAFTAGYNIFKPFSGFTGAPNSALRPARVDSTTANVLGNPAWPVTKTQNGVFVQGTLTF